MNGDMHGTNVMKTGQTNGDLCSILTEQLEQCSNLSLLMETLWVERCHMNIDGTPYRTVWARDGLVRIIDQRHLPFRFVIEDLRSLEEVATAITDMHVRGAGCIGATAGYGMWLAAVEASASSDPMRRLEVLAKRLFETRPTAVNLRWAISRQLNSLRLVDSSRWPEMALVVAEAIADEDAEACVQIGRHGLPLIEAVARTKAVVNILTHCNAGWLAFVDHGSATSPIYAAHDSGISVHVWVDETRPRNQGARLTAWELSQHGVPHTVIADNAGGHLMQRGQVDLVITGSDRTTRAGDVANKIGTYLKALAAKDTGVPFYVALPSSSFDWEITDGMVIPIEDRSPDEVTKIGGVLAADRNIEVEISLTPVGSSAVNPSFDITPRRLVTGLITERGVCRANEEAIGKLFAQYQEKLS